MSIETETNMVTEESHPTSREYTFRYGCLTYYIPEYMMSGIIRYVNYGVEPGSFLTAVISNNLSEAVGQADDNNMPNLPAYMSYFYNETPSPCWGSKEKMKAWMDSFHVKTDEQKKE